VTSRCAAATTLLTVLTTRRKRCSRHLHGAAPEHALVTSSPTRRSSGGAGLPDAGASRVGDRSSLDREGEDRLFIGAYAINPVTARRSHLDQRTKCSPATHGRHHGRAGARRARLPVRHQVRLPICSDRPGRKRAGRAERGYWTTAHGQLGALRRMQRRRAFDAIVDAGRAGLARRKVNFKLRDWLISRQRYWGANPDRLLRALRRRARAGDQLPVLLPTSRTTSPPTTASRRWRATPPSWHHLSARGSGARETDHHGPRSPAPLVSPALPSPHYAEAAFERTAVEYWLAVTCTSRRETRDALALRAVFCKCCSTPARELCRPTRRCATGMIWPPTTRR